MINLNPYLDQTVLKQQECLSFEQQWRCRIRIMVKIMIKLYMLIYHLLSFALYWSDELRINIYFTRSKDCNCHICQHPQLMWQINVLYEGWLLIVSKSYFDFSSRSLLWSWSVMGIWSLQAVLQVQLPMQRKSRPRVRRPLQPQHPRAVPWPRRQMAWVAAGTASWSTCWRKRETRRLKTSRRKSGGKCRASHLVAAQLWPQLRHALPWQLFHSGSR